MMYNKTGAGAFVGRITRYSRPSVRLSVPCQPLTRKRKTVQRSN